MMYSLEIIYPVDSVMVYIHLTKFLIGHLTFLRKFRK